MADGPDGTSCWNWLEADRVRGDLPFEKEGLLGQLRFVECILAGALTVDTPARLWGSQPAR